MAPLCCAAKFDPFLSLDYARVEGVGRNGYGYRHLAAMVANGLIGLFSETICRDIEPK